MASISDILLIASLIIVCISPVRVDSQRNLLHWKHDLEYRINSYLNQRKIIDDIVASSVYAPPHQTQQAPSDIILRGNIRFTDLIIPDGSLLLDRHLAQSTVKILHNKTRSYVSSKMIEFAQINQQFDTIRHQFESQQFIDKGSRSTPPKSNYPLFVQGNRHFTEFQFGNIIDSGQVYITRINHTLVDEVLNNTYMDNMKFKLHDSKSRLFFEGRKTFRRTVFQRPLTSGCCDRLRPIHTSRMMVRSKPQEIFAPVMFQTNDHIMREPIIIRSLSTDSIHNQRMVVGIFNQLNHNGLLYESPPENIIQLANLISINMPNQPKIQKTIVFRGGFMADEMQLSIGWPENTLSIGIGSTPSVRFDLSHENYLLKYPASRRNNSGFIRVAGPFIINSDTLFMSGLEAHEVNKVANFNHYILGNVVRIDRPTNISGFIQFNALPSMFATNEIPQSIQIMRARVNLDVGLLNGMNVRSDIFFIPLPASPQASAPIMIRGPRRFMGKVHIVDHLQVGQLVNGMKMPEGVIPLHLNDFMGSVWTSNLWFLDGITVQQITVESGQFDELILRDEYDNAQDLIMDSMIATQIDGTRLIKAPLRVKNLIVKGWLNGFKAESIMDLNAYRIAETLHGRKTFLAPVEATDCVFNNINHLANWTNQLIRIDRPDTIQTVYTTLAFAPASPANRRVGQQFLPSSIYVDKFGVDFYPNTNPTHYTRNLNFSPELLIIHQALLRGIDNYTGGRYRVTDQVRLLNPAGALINGVALNDIVTRDQPFRFADKFDMVGKVDIEGTLRARHIASIYHIDAMDIVQFDKYRIPIIGSRTPIRLNNLVLSTNNKATFVQCHLLNGVSFNEFANSIMSLTRPQQIDSNLVFRAPVNLEGLVRTGSSLNGLEQFKEFTKRLRSASYSFEDGLQCNSVMIRN